VTLACLTLPISVIFLIPPLGFKPQIPQIEEARDCRWYLTGNDCFTDAKTTGAPQLVFTLIGSSANWSAYVPDAM
jgi:hypothetical protein